MPGGRDVPACAWNAVDSIALYTPLGYIQDMPLFEYRCPTCGSVDERLVRTPAPEAVACRECGAEASRLIPLVASGARDCGTGLGGGGT